MPNTFSVENVFFLKNYLVVRQSKRCLHPISLLSLAGGEKEDQLLLKDLDMEVRYADLDFEFQNLMGGGVVGSTINVIINVLGEEIVKTQKHQIIDALRNGFHSVLTQLF